MGNIVLNEIDKVYDNGFHAVHKLSLDVADGEFLVLVGPSGCGKSIPGSWLARFGDHAPGGAACASAPTVGTSWWRAMITPCLSVTR